MNYALHRLNSMCWSVKFDIDLAQSLMKEIDLNQAYDSESQYTEISNRTTLLEQAVNCLNIPMVKLLLESGADPNYMDPEGEANIVFWDLQYPGRTASENETRLEIAQLLLEFGASPQMMVDGENLFTFVSFYVFHEMYEEEWEYRSRFMILLIAYGAVSDFCLYEIMKEFQLRKMSQYSLSLINNDACSLSAVIVDRRKSRFANVTFDRSYYLVSE